MILTAGTLGRAVVVEPQWIPDSAQGKTSLAITANNSYHYVSVVKIDGLGMSSYLGIFGAFYL